MIFLLIILPVLLVVKPIAAFHHLDSPDLLAPPSRVSPVSLCTFEECAQWRFLEREPRWLVSGGFDGRQPPNKNHGEGYFYVNKSGSAIVASYPLLPNVTHCVTIVYKVCGNVNNTLKILAYRYPMLDDQSTGRQLWKSVSPAEIRCNEAWQMQTLQVASNTNDALVLVINGTRYRQQWEDFESSLKIRNIHIFNTSCLHLGGRPPATTLEPYDFQKHYRIIDDNDEAKVNETTVIEGETFGRLENSADRFGKLCRNESWLINMPEDRVDYFASDDYDDSPHFERRNIIAVHFSWLDIEQSDNCSLAGLNFYDGPNDSYPLIGSFCGNERPREILKTTQHKLFVRFYIQGEHFPSGSGFKFTFNRYADFFTTKAPPRVRTVRTTPRDVTRLYQYFCDFEDGFFCWNMLENWDLALFNWRVLRMAEPPAALAGQLLTLPQVDHTRGSKHGYYAIAPSTGQNPGDVAVLVTTRHFLATQVNCLNFWYFKAGSWSGRLAVAILIKSTESGLEEARTLMVIRGDRGGEWRNAQVAVPHDVTSPFRVQFQATVGADSRAVGGDVALDDIGLFKAWWCKEKQS